jgi:hypothetical protein
MDNNFILKKLGQKIEYVTPFPLSADFKFKQALAKYHQMMTVI